MADRFEELRTFVAVAEAGGVNAAAARLGLAKSAVSRRIAALEERLGVDLLSRETRRFTLTPAGFAHHARAKALLADLDEMERSAAEGERIRPLTVSAPLELAVHVVTPALAALADRRLDTAYRLAVDDPQADVAIAICASHGRRKVDGEIGRAAMARYAAADRDGAPVGASTQHSIDVSAPPAWVPRPTAGSAPLTVETLEMALSAAVAGAGIATLPDFMAAEAVAGGRLAAIGNEPHGPTVTITATVATGVDASEVLAELAKRLRRT